MSRSQFVKAADTKTSVSNSRAQIEKMLRRYGAVGFNVQQTFDADGFAETVTVQFIVPDAPGSKARVPVSLPIEVGRVVRALYGDKQKITVVQWERAERVAWRNLVLWIDAALSATAIGLQTITEAFYAHAVILLSDGSRARLSEVVENSQGQLPPGVRALLALPADTEST